MRLGGNGVAKRQRIEVLVEINGQAHEWTLLQCCGCVNRGHRAFFVLGMSW